MKILGIETSCDETALCIIEGSGEAQAPAFSVLGTSLFSQIKIHEKYGGVFPELAKREHAKNLVPLLKKLLEESGFEKRTAAPHSESDQAFLKQLFGREPELFEACLTYLPTIEKPGIDAIAVTYGPGLEPALWVGINFAIALGKIWNLPVIPVNHMEGHIVSVLSAPKTRISFPSIALLISGGHTELVKVTDWGTYEVIGETQDDAVGEAFDKVARMLGLPYPGGPQISRLAAQERIQVKSKETSTNTQRFTFPRPMLHSHDLNFSFSGLKTAVLYTIKNLPELDDATKQEIAYEFEEAVTDVLISKTKKAIEAHGAHALIIGGGVIANEHIRTTFSALNKIFPELSIHVPEMSLATDNAVMIAMAGYLKAVRSPSILSTDPSTIRAEGSVRL